MDGKSAPRVTALIVPGGPDAWEWAGFACVEAGFGAGDVEVRFEPAVDRGLIWLEGPAQGRHPGADGAGAAARPGPVARELPVRHPNGVTGVDHIVVATPDPERTRAALEDEGLECRYTSTSVGGKRAVQQLAVAIATQVEKDPTKPVPIVKLAKDHYQHKSYGRIFTPVFEVVEWVSMDGQADQSEEPAEEAKPDGAPEPRRRRRVA